VTRRASELETAGEPAPAVVGFVEWALAPGEGKTVRSSCAVHTGPGPPWARRILVAWLGGGGARRGMKIGDIVRLAVGGRQLVCEACGSPFQCGPFLRGCWCSEVKLPEETRGDLRRRYKDCLCPACLDRARESSPPTS